MIPNFISIEKWWIQVKTFIHGMFNHIINIIITLCLGMSIVFTKLDLLIKYCNITTSIFILILKAHCNVISMYIVDY